MKRDFTPSGIWAYISVAVQMTSRLENLWLDRRYKEPWVVQSNKWGRKVWRVMVDTRGVNIRKKNPLNNPDAGILTASKPPVLPQGHGPPGSRCPAIPLWRKFPQIPAHTAHPTHGELLFRSFFHQKASKATSPTFPVSVRPRNASPCIWRDLNPLDTQGYVWTFKYQFFCR